MSSSGSSSFAFSRTSRVALPAGPSFHIPGLAVDEINDFVAKMMRRLQDVVRDLERPESERAL